MQFREVFACVNLATRRLRRATSLLTFAVLVMMAATSRITNTPAPCHFFRELTPHLDMRLDTMPLRHARRSLAWMQSLPWRRLGWMHTNSGECVSFKRLLQTQHLELTQKVEHPVKPDEHKPEITAGQFDGAAFLGLVARDAEKSNANKSTAAADVHVKAPPP